MRAIEGDRFQVRPIADATVRVVRRITFGIDYDDDSDVAVAAAREAGAELEADPAFGPQILEPLEVLGMEDVSATQVTLRFDIKLPAPKLEVTLRNG